ALRVLLQDTAPDVAWNAAVALARLGDEAALPILLPLVSGDFSAPEFPPAQRENLRINAIRAARGIGAQAARAALQRAASSDPSARIRAEARLALEGHSPLPSSSVPEVAAPR
ncbi:MAG TPA: HEAT repeat domain-containing protein, partial [Candidatus Polarisedimenticolia bacterium]|nr:HEAT repeat domain-containing protein [Candidatus Polarisedimenticolia bacterium]